MKPLDFWELTYAEFYHMMKAHHENLKEEFKDTLRLAWYTAAFTRAKDLPKLETVLADVSDKKKQTSEEMMAMAKMLNATHGGIEVKT